jgi:2-methylcitrate dehydratase
VKNFTVKDLLEAMIKAHEIQGQLALLNSFNKVGLDHVVLVKVASTAVVSKLLGLSREQTVDALSQAWADGQSLRTYRHAPNTGPRKSWAAGDACARAVNLALLVQKGQAGMPSVLTAKTWGFYDVLFDGKPFEFQTPYTSYIMENVLLKISYPAEFHAQSAVEAAHILYAKLKELGKSAEDIKSIKIRTQEAAMRIINKKGPLANFADRDHDIHYMVAYPLIHGELTSQSYTDASAADPRIDALRAKITCSEDQTFSAEYHEPAKRSIGNALTVELNDGTVLDEVVVEYPVGHKRRRAEGKPLLMDKFRRHISHHFTDSHQKKWVFCCVRCITCHIDIDTGSSTRWRMRRLSGRCLWRTLPTSSSSNDHRVHNCLCNHRWRHFMKWVHRQRPSFCESTPVSFYAPHDVRIVDMSRSTELSLTSPLIPQTLSHTCEPEFWLSAILVPPGCYPRWWPCTAAHATPTLAAC